MKSSTNIIFISGFKHAGKTTLGKKLAQNLDVPFFDLDELVAYKANKDVKTLYKEVGEFDFREYELETLLTLKTTLRQIVALGGGTIHYPKTLEWLESHGVIFYLNSNLEKIKERIFSKKESYQLIDQNDPEKSLKNLFETRTAEALKLNLIQFNTADEKLLEKMGDYVRKQFWTNL